MHLSLVSDRAILVVVFDRRTSLGLVRLREEDDRCNGPSL